MPMDTPLARMLGLQHPIIQAPMAGGGDTPALNAAVSEAGGMGFIGGAYLSAEQLLVAAGEVRAKTARPFGVNLFAPQPEQEVSEADIERAMAAVRPYYDELGLEVPHPALPKNRFDDQFAAVLESGASAFSFIFGTLPDGAVAELKRRDIIVLGTATTVEEALVLERAGVDAIIAQGSEAGGHRGTFWDTGYERGMVGTMALTPQIVNAVGMPVVAAGAIMDGRGLAAALALGASAVQMGTAFLASDEAGISEEYRNAILAAAEAGGTRVTCSFSGRPARGLVNRFLLDADVARTALPFPLQNALTRPLRTEAARQGKIEYLSLWAGQAASLGRRGSAANVVRWIVQEASAVLSGLADSTRKAQEDETG
ncbi:MAG: nitronate monooxygenase [Rhodocyclaceae bacterium]